MASVECRSERPGQLSGDTCRICGAAVSQGAKHCALCAQTCKASSSPAVFTPQSHAPHHADGPFDPTNKKRIPMRSGLASHVQRLPPCVRHFERVTLPSTTPPPASLEDVRMAARTGGPDPYEGRVLDNQYHLIRRLGVGGMGAVYLAEQMDVGRHVALKLLAPRAGNQKDREARFYSEAKSASSLCHPNIGTVYNFGRFSNGVLFIAMEYVRGVTLGKVIKESAPMPMDRVLDIACQIADGLGEAHLQGIVHRDLKPDNIVLAPRRQGGHTVKILDFGIAVVMEPRSWLKLGNTKPDRVRGTPLYMSPEQAQGEAVDIRSDIYSLGIILYYMISGEFPIKADSASAYLTAHQIQKPKPLSKVVDQVLPVGLENLVMRCLAKKPRLRPQSMEAMLNAFRLIQADKPGSTSDPAWNKQDLLDARGKNWWKVGASVAALLSLLALTGIFLYLAGALDPAHSVLTGNRPKDSSGDALDKSIPERGRRLVKTSAKSEGIPPWVGEAAVAGTGESLWVGRSGPVMSIEQGLRQAHNDVLERFALKMLDNLEDLQLAILVRGLLGGQREELEGSFNFALKKLELVGYDGESEDVFQRFANGQELVAEAVIRSVGEAELFDEEDSYWEHYQVQGTDKSFYLVWASVRVDGENHGAPPLDITSTGRLGLEVVDVHPTLAWRYSGKLGALVFRVAERSPAYRAGVRVGDLVVSAAGLPIDRAQPLHDRWNNRITSSPFQLKVLRPGTGDGAALDTQQLVIPPPRPSRRKLAPSPPKPVHTEVSGGGIHE